MQDLGEHGKRKVHQKAFTVSLLPLILQCSSSVPPEAEVCREGHQIHRHRNSHCCSHNETPEHAPLESWQQGGHYPTPHGGTRPLGPQKPMVRKILRGDPWSEETALSMPGAGPACASPGAYGELGQASTLRLSLSPGTSHCSARPLAPPPTQCPPGTRFSLPLPTPRTITLRPLASLLRPPHTIPSPGPFPRPSGGHGPGLPPPHVTFPGPSS